MGATLAVQRNPTVTINVLDYAGGLQPNGTNDFTTIVNAAITAFVSAISLYGNATLYFPAGVYLGGEWYIENVSNFVIDASRATLKSKNPTQDNTYSSTSNPHSQQRNILTINNCSHFIVRNIAFDGSRDTLGMFQSNLTTGLTPTYNVIGPTANAATSGQSSLTFPGGVNLANVKVNGRYRVMETIGTPPNYNSGSNNQDINLIVQSVVGQVVTFTSTLSHNYTAPILTDYNAEDSQNGLRLVSCQYFLIDGVKSANNWQSGIKLGDFGNQLGCTDGMIRGCEIQNGYDQGISVWQSARITVAGNSCFNTGWGGIVFTHCNDCTAVGNVCSYNQYRVANDNASGSGIAVEGGQRNIIANNICQYNWAHGINLVQTPIYNTNTALTNNAVAGATTLTLTNAGTTYPFNSLNSSSLNQCLRFTIYDLQNPDQSEIIDVTAASGNTLTLAYPLLFNHTSGSSNAILYNATGHENIIIGNTCSNTFVGQGIYCTYQQHTRIEGNICNLNGNLGNNFGSVIAGTNGIKVEIASHNCSVINNICDQNSSEGIFMDTCIRTDVIGNKARYNGIPGTIKNGIQLKGPQYAIIENNDVTLNTNAGLRLETGSQNGIGGDTWTRRPTYCTVTNNQMNKCQQGLLILGPANHLTIANNVVAGSFQAGLDLRGVNNSKIIGNSSTGNSGDNIQLPDNGGQNCTANIIMQNDVQTGSAWGIEEQGTANSNIIEGNLFGSTTSGNLKILGAATVSRFNVGFATEAHGNASITTGNTSVVVTHGLAITPTLEQISVTPQTAFGSAAKFWVSTPTSTQFTINVDANPGQTVTFGWRADVGY